MTYINMQYILIYEYITIYYIKHMAYNKIQHIIHYILFVLYIVWYIIYITYRERQREEERDNKLTWALEKRRNEILQKIMKKNACAHICTHGLTNHPINRLKKLKCLCCHCVGKNILTPRSTDCFCGVLGSVFLKSMKS